MLEIVFGYIICFVELSISHILLNNFLESKNKSRLFKDIVIAVSAVPLLVVNIVQTNFLINGATTLIFLLMGSCFLYSTKFSKRLFISLISASIGFLTEVIVGFGGAVILPKGYEVFDAENQLIFYYLLVIVSRLLQFAVVKIVIMLIPNQYRKIEIRETRVLLFFPILSVFTLFLINYLDVGRPTHKYEHFAMMIVSLGWLVLNLVIMRIYYTALEKHDLKNKLQTFQLRAQADADFFQHQQNNEQYLLRMMHDMKNQLINAFAITDEDSKPVKDYLQELIGVYDLSDKLAITTDYKNKVLNFILNKYIIQLRQLGISLNIQITHFDFSFLSLSDTSRILDNAFENAIAACLKVDDPLRFISFNAYSQNNILYLILRNSKVGELNIQDDIPLTSKVNAAEHGFGFQNIRQATQAYDGSANFEATENEFILIVTLKIDKLQLKDDQSTN